MKYILDTNVISELINAKPNLNVIAFLDTLDEKDIYLNVITIGEIYFGIEKLQNSKKKKRNAFTSYGFTNSKFLLNNQYVKSAIKEYSKDFLLQYFIFVTIPKILNTVQPVRNEAAHGEATSIKECIEFRRKVIGIRESGILCELIGFLRGLD